MRLLFILCIRVSRKFYLNFFFKLRYYIENGARFLQKLTTGFKNDMRNFDNFTKAVESPELKSDRLVCPKNTFLQLKHYMPKIYLTLLSNTCVKIHQISYVILKTIYIYGTYGIFRLSTAWVKIHQFTHVIFQTKSQFFFKVWIFFQCHER